MSKTIEPPTTKPTGDRVLEEVGRAKDTLSAQSGHDLDIRHKYEPVELELMDRRETRHAIGQVIRSSSSTAANYRSACRAKSKSDFISKLGTVEEEADESGFWLEMLRDILQLRRAKSEVRKPFSSAIEIRHSSFPPPLDSTLPLRAQ